MAIKSRFAEWSKLDLERTFGLNQADAMPILEDWIAAAAPLSITDAERDMLRLCQANLIYRGDDWNEAKLTENFIAPILTLVNFNTKAFGIFVGRTLTAVVGDYELSGEPDAVIAKGRRAPEIPYFCFHEYKKENEPKGDPAGQALVAMLVADDLHQHKIPIYGMYVAGKSWYFMVLQGKEYALSLPYSAARDDLFDIVKILKRLKRIIEELTQTPNI